ncbi:response regulator transcription factor [Nonomuraea sp. MCN248]|uniref:Response regulator transcription factor n=1 Tax=Nonomuraea corallina TaxID=2989783 RepID=A0ABT4S4M4_9ACTN|nr:response regulator transcription factor [Nonomuraea corallina]MDA0632154.1 response regulator transcription factor [Nonomuraea corallina]
MTIRVVIADDHAMIRAGLRLVAENAPGVDVVGEAADGVAAVAVTRRERPDVLLLDIAMPRLDGLAAATTLLANPAPPRIVMLTTFGSDENLHAALRTGVSGFLLKSSPPEHLVEAVRVAAAGDGMIDPAVTLRVIASFAAQPLSPPPELDTLTPRELDVLRLLTRGLSNREIATEAGISEATIRGHVAQVLRKLGVRDRLQAVVFAYESGFVRPGRP